MKIFQLFVVASLLLHTGALFADAKRPNVLLICVDDLRPELGCYGRDWMHTPHIDQLAATGRRFERHYVQAATCGASRYALLSGLRPGIPADYSNKPFEVNQELLRSRPTESFAHLFKQHGYTTVSIGKVTHGSPRRLSRSWSRNIKVNADNWKTHPPLEGGIPPAHKRARKREAFEAADTDDLGYQDGWIAQGAIDALKELKEAGEPFLLAAGFIRPHLPFNAPRRYWDLYKPEEIPATPWPALPENTDPAISSHAIPSFELVGQYHVPEGSLEDPAYIRNLRHGYLASVSYVDALVGKLLATLDELELADNTVVVLWGDHGWHLGDLGVWGKHTAHEHAMHSPLIVRTPGMNAPGESTDALIETVDIYPTLARLCNLPLPEGLEGDSFDNLLQDPRAQGPEAAFSYHRPWGRRDEIGAEKEMIAGPWARTIRTDRWRLTRWTREIGGVGEVVQMELYDHTKDPGETRNIAAEQPEVVAQLVRKLAEQHAAPPSEVGDRAERNRFFNGTDLAGWSGNEGFWSVEDGAIVGHSDEKVRKNEFLWSEVPVENFYLSVDVKLTPADRNAGVQFRSRKVNDHGQAHGYQADVGRNVWGKLYHEHGRGKLGWNDLGLEAVKPDGWNRYEILAVGDHIWLALNGTLCVALRDPEGEREGHIALQIHSGPSQTVRYRNPTLIHDPEVKLAGMTEKELKAAVVEAGGDPKKAPGSEADRSGRNTGEADQEASVRRFGSGGGPAQVTPPFPGGKFALERDDVVVFMGQTDMVRSRLDGTLDATLAKRFAGQTPVFRNMAWESDTVFEQWRDIDFGSWQDQLNAVGANVVIAQFGQIEALDGVGHPDAFIAAYEKLLDQVATRTRRVVLLSPRPFEKPLSPHMPDHRSKNEVVAKYRDAIRLLAGRRGALFVDLFEPFEKNDSPLTSNGIHLTAQARPRVAGVIAEALGVSAGEIAPELRAAMLEKNRLWFDNWRPMNWSFAFGDRTKQRFGKPIGDRPPLKVELEAFKALVKAADQRIHRVASGRKEVAAVPEVTQPAPAPESTEAHSPRAELDSFRVLDGFEVNLFASEADGVVKPVQMRWDDRGRLWVICIPTYPHIEPGLRPGDYILVCEDTDGDGKADKFDRFAEGLFIPMGLEFGDGGLYVTEATELVHLKDTDGDGKADQRTVILSGFGTADSHQMVNGLERGPLGDLWFTQGHHAFSRVETPFGISKLEKAGVWRYRPKTGRLDGFFNQSRAGLNAQGVTHDDWGQTFHNSAAGSGGFYTTAGAIPTGHTQKLWPLTPSPSRNTGIEFIGSSHLPDDLQGQIVWGGFMSNTIQFRKVVDQGAGFLGEKLPDLIQSDRREFRPVNVRIGPDGAIYVCDWYNPTIGHYQASYRDPARDRTHGRIWRITARGRPLSKAPDFEGLSPLQLLELLRSPERLTRTNAGKHLFDLPAGEVMPVVKQWLAGLDRADPAFAHLLFQAGGIFAAHEEVSRELVEEMIGSEEHRVRAIGARLVGRWWDRLEQPLMLLEKTVADEHPRVRMETVIAASYVPGAESIRVVAKSLDHAEDRYIDYAFGLAVRALRPHWLPALKKGELDFAQNPQHLSAILSRDNSEDTLELVRQLARGGAPEDLALLARIGNPGDLEYAFREGGKHPEVLEVLLEVARVHGKMTSGNRAHMLAGALGDGDASLEPYLVALIGAWKVDAMAEEVRKRLSSDQTGDAIRLAAMEAAAALEDSESVAPLEKFASMERPAAFRTAAIRSLSLLDPARAAARTYALLPAMSVPGEVAPMLAALIEGPGQGAKLAKLVRSGQLDEAALTRLQQGLGLTGQTCAPLNAAIASVRKMPSVAPTAYDAAYLTKLKDLVESSGDAKRGALAYQKAATCAGCHKIDGVGGDIGPDLTEVGSGRSLELLIESVLWPNRQIREGYMTTRITTRDKQIHTGYLLSEEGGVINLRDIATPNVKKIARESVRKEEEAGSAMVIGLTAALSREELADLIAYLASLKKK